MTPHHQGTKRSDGSLWRQWMERGRFCREPKSLYTSEDANLRWSAQEVARGSIPFHRAPAALSLSTVPHTTVGGSSR